MVKIDKVIWGKVKVNGQEHQQVLIVGDQVMERETDKLHRLFKTTHQIGDWERELLMSQKPDVILIANGWSGVLKVSEDFKKKLSDQKIELKIVLTSKVADEYEKLLQAGKRVNVLIHTTC